MKRLCRPVLFLGIILLIFLTFWIPERVLFISVEGNSTISSVSILQAAEAYGIHFGIDRQSIRSEPFKNYMLNYAGFEPEGFYVGPISDNDKCEIKGTFKKPHSKKTVTAKEVKKMKDCILVTYTPFKVQVNGDIKYVSTNCKVDEDNVVSTSPNKGELSYIVYDIDQE